MEEKLQQLTIGRSAIIGVIIAALYWFFFYNSGAVIEDQIVSAQQGLVASRAEIQKMNKALKDAERYHEMMRSLGSELDRVVKAIPEKLNSLDLMKIISTEAKGIGVEINNLSSPQSPSQAQQGDKSKFYDIVPLEFDITGTYNQIMLFLSNLTKLDMIITAQKMTFTIVQKGQLPKSSSVPSVNLKASLQAYRYVPQSDDTLPRGGGR